jgi:hypothetical protein
MWSLYNEAANTDNAQLNNPTLNRKLIPAGLAMANTDWQKEIFQGGADSELPADDQWRYR